MHTSSTEPASSTVTQDPTHAHSNSEPRAMRVIYAAGPGDIIGTFRHWREGRDDPGQVAMTYSGQFFDVCRELGVHGYAIASHPRREVVEDGPFRIAHRTIPFAKAPGPLYHLGQIWTGARMVATALRYRADAVVICDGTCHWFPLRVLPRLGIAIIPTIHCMLWKRSSPPKGGAQRIIQRLNRTFWKRSTHKVLSASSDISRQLDQITNGVHAPVIEFLPTYRTGTFETAAAPPPPPPFRVLFAGRIEGYKGVFDLLEIARRFKASGRTDIEFDLCGNGSAIDELQRQVLEAGQADSFRLHGHCDRPKMREMFRRSHVLIVPTTTDFAEGFNQVVVEGILAGRPVITSDVCPALEYVRDAVIEVPPDDVNAYQSAIVQLLDNPTLYKQKRAACTALQNQFYDPSRGWAAALRTALLSVRTRCGSE